MSFYHVNSDRVRTNSAIIWGQVLGGDQIIEEVVVDIICLQLIEESDIGQDADEVLLVYGWEDDEIGTPDGLDLDEDDARVVVLVADGLGDEVGGGGYGAELLNGMEEAAFQGDADVGTATVDQEANLDGLICDVGWFAKVQQVHFILFESSIIVVGLAQLNHEIIAVHIAGIQLDRHSLRQIHV